MRARRSARVAALAVATLALAACDRSDPVAPAPEAAPPNLQLELQLSAAPRPDAPREVVVSSGWFTPGTDADGALAAIEAPLRVGAATLFVGPPSDPRQTGIGLSGQRADAAALPGERPLRVVPPVVRGRTASPATIDLATVRALDADTLRLGAAGPAGALRVRTRSALPPADAPPPVLRRWTVGVTGATRVAWTGSGVPPADLAFARELLPEPRDGRWTVTFEFEEVHGRMPFAAPPVNAAAPYAPAVRLRQTHAWILLP